jgi:hypothetical protein
MASGTPRRASGGAAPRLILELNALRVLRRLSGLRGWPDLPFAARMSSKRIGAGSQPAAWVVRVDALGRVGEGGGDGMESLAGRSAARRVPGALAIGWSDRHEGAGEPGGDAGIVERCAEVRKLMSSIQQREIACRLCSGNASDPKR